MKLHELSPAKGSKHSKKRVGRGPGSGLGKTAGRGEKGQKSRTGYSSRPGFEGGQMPLVRRVPKRGFTNIFKTEYAVVNLSQLAELEGDVTPESLKEQGLVRSGRPVKVLGDGEIGKALRVTAHKFSKSARAKIEAAGGTCEELRRDQQPA
jgi:large subunit ribosomal protein L15